MKVTTGIKAGAGLGDATAQATHLMGIDRLAATYTQITGKPCGCKERQAKLNQLFSFPTV